MTSSDPVSQHVGAVLRALLDAPDVAVLLGDTGRERAPRGSLYPLLARLVFVGPQRVDLWELQARGLLLRLRRLLLRAPPAVLTGAATTPGSSLACEAPYRHARVAVA